MKEKNLGFLISSLTAGGAERVVSMLANQISTNRKVVVFTLSKNKPHYTLNSNIKLIQIGVPNNSKNPIKALTSNFFLIKELNKLVRKFQIRHLICFMTTSSVLGIISGKFFCKIKVTISERSNPFLLNVGIWASLRKLLYRYADKLVVQTDFIKSYYSKYVPSSKIEIINNPINMIDNEMFKKENIIINVGRLDSNKNQIQLINTFSRIQHKGWKLIFCGDGTSRADLEALVFELELTESVFFLGKVQNVNDYYSKASIFAFTSLSEGFPNTLLEAMSYGCACITTNCVSGSNNIIKDNHNGFLIAQGDYESYDSQLRKLMQDDELRQKFVKNSNISLKNYSVIDISAKWD